MSQPLRQMNGRAVSGRISGARGPLALLLLPLCCVALLGRSVPRTLAQDVKSFDASLVVRADQPKGTINRNLYGQFAEHLGACGSCLERTDFQRRLKEIVRLKCGSEHLAPEHLLGKVQRAIESEQAAPGG